MIQIDDKIVSLDILSARFACDLNVCRGICCVEGNSGAPLEADEPSILENEYAAYKPYLKPAGIEAIERDGFGVIDSDGDLTTPLIDNAECAYSFCRDGVTYCAIERAYRDGRSTFPKPVSCHLYPIRVKRFRNGTYGLNYHRWDVCASAEECGKRLDVPLFRVLKEPIVRRFGEEFFEALVEAEKFVKQNQR